MFLCSLFKLIHWLSVFSVNVFVVQEQLGPDNCGTAASNTLQRAFTAEQFYRFSAASVRTRAAKLLFEDNISFLLGLLDSSSNHSSLYAAFANTAAHQSQIRENKKGCCSLSFTDVKIGFESGTAPQWNSVLFCHFAQPPEYNSRIPQQEKLVLLTSGLASWGDVSKLFSPPLSYHVVIMLATVHREEPWINLQR